MWNTNIFIYVLGLQSAVQLLPLAAATKKYQLKAQSHVLFVYYNGEGLLLLYCCVIQAVNINSIAFSYSIAISYKD